MTDAALAPDRFPILRQQVSPGLSIAYHRLGAGGYPLLLVHGYPETKRIWWRNLEALAACGFDVIAPDLRGYGDSTLAPDGFYDLAAFSTDCHALLVALGITRCSVVGGDLGGPVVVDLALRFPGFVERLVFFNTMPPFLPDAYAAAGIPPLGDHRGRPQSDYFLRQGRDADGLIAELDTPERRVAYIADFYGHRLWAAPGGFTPEEARFMAAPFADRDKLRASWGAYEMNFGRAMSDVPRYAEPVPVRTLLLFGPEDHVVAPTFMECCRVAFLDRVGPLVVPGAGHFLQWEAAEVFNATVAAFLGDVRERAATAAR